MATFIQSFKSGYITREGDKYQYVENEKVVGTYDSIEKLVSAQMGDEAQLSTTDSTSFRDELKSKPAKTTRKKTAKK